LERAEKLNIPTYVFTKEALYSQIVLDKVKSYQPDLIVLAGFLLQFPISIIKEFPNILNIHPALLPKYGGKGMYGMNVHRAVLENKELETGITIHFVTEHYDEGEIVFQKTISVEDCSFAEEVAEKIHQLEQEYFPAEIEKMIQKFNLKTYEVHIYTDGAAKGNPGNGGYGVVMELVGTPNKKEFYEGFRYTTNNRMELLAVIVGLEKLKNQNMKVLITSDSKYVIDSVEKKWVLGWEKKGFTGKKNPDLWKRFLKIYRQHQVDFKWVKGHNNHPQNERCDQLAVYASGLSSLSVDAFYEKEGGKLF
jgi:ribonuclease HI